MEKEKQSQLKQVSEENKIRNGIDDYRFQTPAMCDGITAENASNHKPESHWEDFKDSQSS